MRRASGAQRLLFHPARPRPLWDGSWSAWSLSRAPACCGASRSRVEELMGPASEPCRRCIRRRVLAYKVALVAAFFVCAAAASWVRGGWEAADRASPLSSTAGKNPRNGFHRRLQQDFTDVLNEAQVVDDSMACLGCTPHEEEDERLPADLVPPRVLQCAEVGRQLLEDRCEQARHCNGAGRGLINYTALHFCELQGVSWFSVPLLIAGVLVAFVFLAETAENYFSPAVSYMVTVLGLTPSTGGVTLLAFGNGAPDLFASVAAIRGGNPRVGLGAILSAGTFVSTFVVGCVALAAAPFSVAAFPFVRDIIFYAIAVCLLFGVYLSGIVYFWEAVGFIVFYCVFALVVVVTDQIKGVKDAKASFSPRNASKKRIELTDEMVVAPGKLPLWEGSDSLSPNTRSPEVDRADSWWGSGGVGTSGLRGPMLVSRRILDKVVSGYSYFKDSAYSSPPKTMLSPRLPSMQKKSSSDCCGQPAWKYRMPVEVLLKATIPVIHPSQWSRHYATANMVLCPLALLYMCGSQIPLNLRISLTATLQLPLWGLVVILSLLVGTAYYLMSEEPPESQHLLPAAIAFAMSVCWISFMAGELLGCLVALGVILRIPPALLGITVLAWGNSMGDLVGDVAVARNGQPALAMAGCFAGPMFNMLIGLGVALATATSESLSPGYTLRVHPSILIAFGFLFTGLLGSLVVMIRSRFQITRCWGFTLVGWYVLFMAVSITIALQLGA